MSIFLDSALRDELSLVLHEVEKVAQEQPQLLENLISVATAVPEKVTGDWITRYFFNWKARKDEAETLAKTTKTKEQKEKKRKKEKKEKTKEDVAKKLEELEVTCASQKSLIEKKEEEIKQLNLLPASNETDSVSFFFLFFSVFWILFFFPLISFHLSCSFSLPFFSNKFIFFLNTETSSGTQ